MDRRKAIGLITAAAAGLAIIPSCKPNAPVRFQRLTLKQDQEDLITVLSNKILPIPDNMVMVEVSPTQFMLTMLDDCASAEDIKRFEKGLSVFEAYLEKNSIATPSSIEIERIQELINPTEEAKENIKDCAYFLETIKRYNVHYYTTLQSYYAEYTDWEFAPGHFFGCVPV